jgi:hypothetical protein
MAKLKLNPAMAEITGKIGNMVHRRLWGQQVVSHLPDFSKYVRTDKQVAENTRFGNGSVQWRGLAAAVKEQYTARAKELNMPPCALFQKTKACPPLIDELDLSQYTGQPGQTIRIRAHDLVDLASVALIIREPGGQQLETGEAARPGNGEPYWVYQSTKAAANPSGVTAEVVVTNWAGRSANRMELLGS